MSNQKINCMVNQCKHNGQENFCELKSIKIGDIKESSQADHETLCTSFENK